ncbi:MAG: heavy-metal-associated domain-containing protein [Veillonellaceae bacterium]|nr:heavy-metal-associated domain-containing protein [Veillonellaceae bacterium]
MTRTLRVEGMHCENCVRAVENALKAVAGVTAVQVDLAAGRATVTGEALQAATLCAAIEDIGFEASCAD